MNWVRLIDGLYVYHQISSKKKNQACVGQNKTSYLRLRIFNCTLAHILRGHNSVFVQAGLYFHSCDRFLQVAPLC